jgi:tRNA 2-thiouridine synthesizing protein B
VLHCLHDPVSANGRRLRDVVREGDAILLLGTAVTLARPRHPALADWLVCGAPLYALREDLQLHGVDVTDPRVEVVDYSGWVELLVQLPKQLDWR